MPKGTVREDDPYPIPTDTLVPVVLTAVSEVNVPFTYKQGPKAGTAGSFTKWEWDCRVIDGEYTGVEVRGSTEAKFTNASHASGFLALAKPFAEAFMGRETEVGEEVDTDQLIGLVAQATVRHLEPRPRRDGDGFWFNIEIDEIFPMAPTNGQPVRPDPVPAGRVGPQDAVNQPWAQGSTDDPWATPPF